MARKKRTDDDDDATTAIALPPLDPIGPDARDAKVIELQTLKAEIKRLEADADRLGRALIDGLFAEGLDSYEIPGVVKVAIQNKTTRTIDAVLLVAAGVDPDVIAGATKTTVSDPFVRLYPKAAKSE